MSRSLCLLLLTSVLLHADLRVNGDTLTVTTADAVASFRGADLAALSNTLTGENYLRSGPAPSLIGMDLIQPTGEPLASSGWILSGQQAASITFADSVRTVSMQVSIDPDTGEIVIGLNGQSKRRGVRGAMWGISGLDLKAGRLVLPAAEGTYVDAGNFPGDTWLDYPTHWQYQMFLFESSQGGGFQVYSTDRQALFKRLHLAPGGGNSTVSVSLMTDAPAPFPSAADVPAIEWRLWCFQGNWRTAAARYRNQIDSLRPPVAAQGNRGWVPNIRTVVILHSLDTAVLGPLAARMNAAKTLLYLPAWRKDPYDVNYPDYTPHSNAWLFVDRAHALGFRVMLHTDIVGVSPGNPDYAAVRQYQVKHPETLAPTGWYWDHPASDPQRFAFINPAASPYRKLFIDRLRPAVEALQPDAIHLDVSGAIFEDGNGLIEGMNFGQGSIALHRDLLNAFPDVVLAGESVHELLAPYEWFAQRWSAERQVGRLMVAHPVSTYLLGEHVLLYGYLGQPSPEDPGFLQYFQQYERQGVVPTPVVRSASDLDTSRPATARLLALANLWQKLDLAPDWEHDWNGALFQYLGSDGALAALRDTGTRISFSVDDRLYYQRVHGTTSLKTSLFISGWPAYDAQALYGLDPDQQYWLEDRLRPSDAAHVSRIPDGVKLGTRTLVTNDFAYLDLVLAQKPGLDFVKALWLAQNGTTYEGVDGPLVNGATAVITTMTVGGESRTALFEHPPYQGTERGGETFVEYSATVPDATGAALEFAAGINDSATRTEAVRFRITVNGAEVWRRDIAKGAWQPGRVDLAGFRGQSVAIRFITHPGPNLNTSFAWAGWSAIRMITDPVATRVSVEPAGQEPAAINVTIQTPGSALLFLRTPRSIGVGQSLLDFPFTSWLSSAGSLPVTGSIYSSGTISSAVSGGISKARTINAHPPGYGQTILTWTLALPDTDGLKFGVSAGIADGANSNGVAFSVRVNGRQIWRFETSKPGWKTDGADVSSWRGQNVLLELVTDSLADNSYDWARWADLAIMR
ncbi:MAG: hypothetical protein HY235_08520 [Acidobacteria bacterium]|nr:hypothetical protein [Acidobacteriota bacterium]